MQHNFQDLTGKKFNRLTVVKFDKIKSSKTYWICRCDCGNEISVRADQLKSGNTKACGCLYRKHGHALQGNHSRLYGIFNDMKRRCYNRNNKSFKFYGAKGITVCEDWMSDDGFIRFCEWSINNGYSEDLSIDRIDPNGQYSPQNCRWVEWGIQANNKSNSLKITYNGKTQSLAAWCRELNLNYSKVRQRIYHGKPFELAIIGADA